MDWKRDDTMIDLQEVKDYLFCSLLYYLKYRRPLVVKEAGMQWQLPSYTTLDLPGLAIEQALKVHATGQTSYSFPVLVDLVWKAWFAQKGIGDDVYQSLRSYAGVRNKILNQFLSGAITNKAHQPYTEPRMTNRYKEMMDRAGLEPLSQAIDEAALEKIGAVAGEFSGIGGYSLASAYADSLHMTRQYSPPLPEAIYGVQVKTVVRLPNKEVISATADLVILGADSATIEFHDFDPVFTVQSTWIGRRLEVIAAMEMQAVESEKSFPKVERVIYRHFMSGKTLERRSVREARLVFALEAAVRGIEAGIYTPQFLSGDITRCRGCPAREICIPASGDLFEWFLPGDSVTGGITSWVDST